MPGSRVAWEVISKGANEFKLASMVGFYVKTYGSVLFAGEIRSKQRKEGRAGALLYRDMFFSETRYWFCFAIRLRSLNGNSDASIPSSTSTSFYALCFRRKKVHNILHSCFFFFQFIPIVYDVLRFRLRLTCPKLFAAGREVADVTVPLPSQQADVHVNPTGMNVLFGQALIPFNQQLLLTL